MNQKDFNFRMPLTESFCFAKKTAQQNFRTIWKENRSKMYKFTQKNTPTTGTNFILAYFVMFFDPKILFWDVWTVFRSKITFLVPNTILERFSLQFFSPIFLE